MATIRILAIVPYEGMRLSLLEAAKYRKDIEITIFVGDLEKGVSIAQDQFQYDYDVILSRGGTAEMIRESTGFPTIELPLSVFDILRAIRLAQTFSERHAIVGFPNVTECAFLIKEIMNNNIDVFSIRSQSEAQALLERLQQEGYLMVIGDMITSQLAKQIGMQSILITSGFESIENAFDLAVNQCMVGRQLKQQNALITQLIEERGKSALIFNGKQQLVFSSLTEETQEFMHSLKKEVVRLQEKGNSTFFRKGKTKAVQYIVEGRVLQLENDPNPYFSFFLTPQLCVDHAGILYIDQKSAEKRCMNNFLNIALQSHEAGKTINRCVTSTLPLMIEGEVGTGKDSLALSLFTRLKDDYLMLIIDCAVVQEKGWKHLFLQTNSPLYREKQVIYLKNFSHIPERHAWTLQEWIKNSILSGSVRFVFSVSLPETDDRRQKLYAHWKENIGAYLRVTLPPLRESVQEFQNLVTLCINTINFEHGTQVMGIEEEGMHLLCQFSWQENYSQLKRVLTQAILISNRNIVPKTIIQTLLSKEVEHNSNGLPLHRVAAGRTLREIEHDIVKLTLAEENNNQSRTAKRLGISRSRLWRMLNEK